MNRLPPTAKIYILLAVEAVFFAFAATVCVYLRGNVVGILFGDALTIDLLLALLVWCFVAWTARRVIVGSVSGMRLKGRPIIVFGLLRFGLILSFVIVLLSWLIAAIARISLASTLNQAAVLLILTFALMSMAGGAVINSLLAIRHRRQRSRL